MILISAMTDGAVALDRNGMEPDFAKRQAMVLESPSRRKHNFTLYGLKNDMVEDCSVNSIRRRDSSTKESTSSADHGPPLGSVGGLTITIDLIGL